MISVLLTVVMICCTTFWAKADQVDLQRSKKSSEKVRFILLNISHLSVNLDNNVIHVDFLFLLRDVNVSIVSSDGRLVHQQVVSPQTSSVDINLSGEGAGTYTIYFTDATGVCLNGIFVVSD